MNDLIKKIGECVSGLIYMSEADNPVEVFAGNRAAENSKSEIRKQTGHAETDVIEEISIEDFFEKLTAVRSWYGTREKEQAEKFLKLKDLVARNLKDPKVFRIGRIQIEIYAVGIDKEGKLTGIKTTAVET